MHSKKFWIEVTVIGVIGIIMIVAGIAMGGGFSQLRQQFKFVPTDKEMLALKDAERSEIENIVINTSESKVTIREEDDYRIASDDICEQYVRGNTLYIGYSEDNSYSVDLPTGEFKVVSKKIAGKGNIGITLPRDARYSSIKINGRNTRINAKSLKADKIECDINGGNLKIDSIDANNASFNTKKCPVHIGGGNITNSCNIETKWGAVTYGDNSADINTVSKLNVITGWSPINITGALRGECYFESAHGKIDLTLNGSQNDYSINGDGTTPDTKGMIKVMAGNNKLNVKYK